MAHRLASSLLLGLAACAFRPTGGQPTDGDADVTGDAAPDDGATDAPVDAPTDAPGTTADACTPVCGTDEIVSCGEVVESCPAGCSTTGGVHCKLLLPSNGVSAEADLDGVDAGLTLMTARLYVFDTDTGEIRHYPLDGSGGGAVVRAAGLAGLDPASRIRWRTLTQATPPGSAGPPELSIFGVASLTIPDGTVLRPVGGRASVIVARGAIMIAGEVDVGGGRLQSPQGGVSVTVPGPGGGPGGDSGAAARGCAAGGAGTRQILGGGQNRDTGGGGGGFGTAGGDGGPASLAADGGGAAVTAVLLPVLCAQSGLVPLRGGSGGGASRDNGGGDLTRGGGGGGALQLTSFTSITIADGAVYAGGAGGAGDGEAPGAADGGGAGGSGGGILFEAPAITLTAGSVTATGGAGGAGNGNASSGQSGLRTGEPAQPTGNGGRGATGGGAGEVGADDGTGDIDGTGGGGGGAGLIHLRSVRTPAIDATIVRPAASTSTAPTTD